MARKLDTHAVNELILFAENDSHLYNRIGRDFAPNLLKKMAKGKYDRDAAIKLWEYYTADAAKKYHKDMGGMGNWYDMFPKPERRKAAEYFRDWFEEAVEEGQFT